MKIPPGDFKALRAMLAKGDGQGHDHRNWARRILDRHANGERIPFIALQAARDALAAPVWHGTTTFHSIGEVAANDETQRERDAIRREGKP